MIIHMIGGRWGGTISHPVVCGSYIVSGNFMATANHKRVTCEKCIKTLQKDYRLPMKQTILRRFLRWV